MQNETLSVFKIEENIVTEKEFRDFYNSLVLTKLEETYICKKTIGGGHNFVEAKSKNGSIYMYESGIAYKIAFEYISKIK